MSTDLPLKTDIHSMVEPDVPIAELLNQFRDDYKQGRKGRIADIIGQWPGDETDEEIDAYLEEIS